MTEVVELDRLTRLDLQHIAPRATAILPLGSTEQHGSHLPFGTDTFLSARIALAAARRACHVTGPFALAPPLPYGRSQHHLKFGGALSLRSQTLLAILSELFDSLVGVGFRSVFVINGHGGNDALMRASLRDAADGLPLSVGGVSYWAAASRAFAAQTSVIGAIPGHAGVFETSLLFAVQPELVRNVPRIGPPPQPRDPEKPTALTIVTRAQPSEAVGTSDNAEGADAHQGRILLTIIEHELSRILVDFHTRAMA
jgi:creatinine amidohydrolase